jgi:Cof subfamily protein (haloacid dehalogenase superfamily)
MHDIKMVITDLDGTFMESHYVPNRRNIEVMHEAMRKGVICCACTARNWALASYPVKVAGFNDCVVLCNGAAIMDTRTMQLRYRNRIEPNLLKKLLDIVSSVEDCEYSIFLTDAIVAAGGLSGLFRSIYEQPDNSPQKRDEKLILAKDADEMFKLCKDGTLLLGTFSHSGSPLPQRMFERIIELGEFSLTSAHPGSIHIMAQDGSKLRGAQILADIYEIPRENILTVGDNHNDIGMIEWAGVGVAVGNAEEEVKEAADYISCANTEGAVAQAIEEFVI